MSRTPSAGRERACPSKLLDLPDDRWFTNLANRVQPILRYELGDSVTIVPAPCPCGNALPVIEVAGRSITSLSANSAGDLIAVSTSPSVSLGSIADSVFVFKAADGSEIVSCLEYEPDWAFGPNCGISDLDALGKLTWL